MPSIDQNITSNQATPIYHDYLLFLEPGFKFSNACSIENIGFIIGLLGLGSYLLILLYFKNCGKKASNNFGSEQEDEKMTNIIKEYKKELEIRQTSFSTVITDSNMTSKSESFFMMNTSTANAGHGLPFFGIDSTSGEPANFGEHSVHISSEVVNKIQHEPRQDEILQPPRVEIPSYNDIKKEATEIAQQSEDERREKARKEIVAPPTFSDRFEVMAAAKNMEKKPINNSPSSSVANPSEQEIILVKAKKIPKSGNQLLAQKDAPIPKGNSKGKGQFSNKSKGSGLIKNSRKKLLMNKFWQLLQCGNPIISTFYKPESKFFPRHLRLTFLYFYINTTSLLATFPLINTLNKKLELNSVSYLVDALFIGFLGWLLFFLFTIFFTVKKDSVLKTRNDNDLQNLILHIDKEVKLNIVLAYLIIHISGLICLAQVVALPTAISMDLFQTWILTVPLVGLFYQGLLDLIFFFILATIFVFARELKSIKKVYLLLSRMRAWKV